MTEDTTGRGDLLLRICEEETHHAQENHSSGVHLQLGHITWRVSSVKTRRQEDINNMIPTDQFFISVFMRGVAAPGTDEDVGVSDLHVQILGQSASIQRLLVEVCPSAQQEHLGLQIRPLQS